MTAVTTVEEWWSKPLVTPIRTKTLQAELKYRIQGAEQDLFPQTR